MPRSIPRQRIDELLDVATELFIERGFRRTQMDDVAERLGVAKGTVYGYVEGKDALFAAALHRATGSRVPAEELPLSTPAPGATLELVRRSLETAAELPSLQTALDRPGPPSLADLEAVIDELWRVVHDHRVAIKLIDRCARDAPEMADAWFAEGRYRIVDGIAELLGRLAREEAIPAGLDARVTSRMVVETIAFWGVHRHWDPAPQELDETAAEATVKRLLLRSLRP